MDEYRVNGSKAETFKQERVLLWMDITWQSEWLGCRTFTQESTFTQRESPFMDGYFMEE